LRNSTFWIALRKKRGKTTVREQIMLYLYKYKKANTTQIARALGKHYMHIRNLLYDLKRREFVKSEYVRRYFPGRRWVLVNEWSLTPEGIEWLKGVRLL